MNERVTCCSHLPQHTYTEDCELRPVDIGTVEGRKRLARDMVQAHRDEGVLEPDEAALIANGWLAVEGVIPNATIYAKWTEAEDGRIYLSGLCLPHLPITADLLRSVPVGRLENLPRADNPSSRVAVEELPTLRRNQGEDPSAFAERVAKYYRAFSQLSSKPAKLISEHSEVPLPTVHGWIREARLRGKLPPGRKGKAG